MEYSMHIVIFYSVSPVVTGDRVMEIITTQTLIFLLYNFFSLHTFSSTIDPFESLKQIRTSKFIRH